MLVCQIGRLEEGKSQGISLPFPLRFFGASLAIVLFSLWLQYPFTPRLRIPDQG